MVAPCEDQAGYDGVYKLNNNRITFAAAAAAAAAAVAASQNRHHRSRPSRLSMETLQRTISDISWELSCKDSSDESDDEEGLHHHRTKVDHTHTELPSIPEIEDAKCECCGLCEECTQEYIERVRNEFAGRLICGLCAEAANQEMEKNGGKREEAVAEHMNACIRFNRLGRAYPVLCQAEAMREILKKNRAKSLSPRVNVAVQRKGGKISRSSSCMPAFAKEIKNA